MVKNSLIAAFGLAAILMLVPITAYGQAYVTDVTCNACQKIPDQRTLERYIEITPIVIWSDSPIYDRGSTIDISGHSNIKSKLPVLVKVTNSLGSIVGIEQAIPDENGDFAVSFKPSGSLWKQEGFYIITAQSGDGSGGKIFRIQVKVVDYAGSDMLVRYEIEGGSVTGITADDTAKSLLITLENTEDDGFIKLYLPRDIIDSKNPTKEYDAMAGVAIERTEVITADKDFVVTVDDNRFTKMDPNFAIKEFEGIVPVGHFTQDTSINTRIVTIPFEAGTEQIVITGTFVVPEFGSIAAIILAASIVAIVLFSRSSKINFLKTTI